ncbi:membrane protein [Lasius niger]|uniref:Membrane protein n=1 Tax=Lasius niger TaxID=67767 RepID=A0A0J7L2K7_LASNI|nr:membrane protein [Lasius niger]
MKGIEDEEKEKDAPPVSRRNVGVGGQELLEIREIEIRGIFVRSDSPSYLRDFQLHRLGPGTVMSSIFLRYSHRVAVLR